MDKNQNAWNDLLELLLTTKDKKSLDFLLDLFLTPEEKTDIAMRFLIVKNLLDKNKTQREIAKDLHVSIAKITRGSNELKRMNRSLLKALEEKISAQKNS